MDGLAGDKLCQAAACAARSTRDPSLFPQVLFCVLALLQTLMRSPRLGSWIGRFGCDE